MEPTTVSLPLIEIATLVLGTGVVATIVNQVFEWLKDRSKASKLAEQDATYLAARVAVTLEQFAIKCAETIADNDMHRTSGGHAGSPHGTLPPLGNYPSKADWTTLDPALLTRSLSIPNELSLAERTIAFWSDVDPDPSLVRGACDAQAGKCGYRAWQLAAEMRSRYGLPEFIPTEFSWDMVKILKKEHDRELERMKADRENDSEQKEK